MRQIRNFPSLFIWLALTTMVGAAQVDNLLQNPKVDGSTNHWRAYGEATIDRAGDDDWHFVVRNRGYFVQDINLPEDAAEKYALLIGRVSSERINSDGAITGLPYLYGYMMDSVGPTGGRVLSYLQGQQMLCWSKKENEWVTAWGVFQIPIGTGAVRFFLNQAERKGVPQNGSAARFDDLGLFLFSSEEEAKTFAQRYKTK